jgi:hypothetical protein
MCAICGGAAKSASALVPSAGGRPPIETFAGTSNDVPAQAVSKKRASAA